MVKELQTSYKVYLTDLQNHFFQKNDTNNIKTFLYALLIMVSEASFIE